MSLPHHPLLKNDEINAAMKGDKHYLNRDAERISVCMSDVVGMQDSGLGVHKVRLEPNGESTQIHYHLHDSEWLYILSGSGILQLIDASIHSPERKDNHPRNGSADIPKFDAPSLEGTKTEIEERQVGPGDFIGFQGGVAASKYAHGLKASSEGLVYLMGGTREKLDVCCYPELGVSNISDAKSGQEVIARFNPVDTSGKAAGQ
ncbi:uncharacterized protein I303_105563 [Kwoniella dejecticola CBS 10117]|uniref:Cupin type-1 domain-containing protein n=1 Tax=Kwoniella dejecticola CBS 10117 TaxID=1296121 RepID=A0A1A6A246_9TREE|nr:uncharacterized protein I303_04994 [Kwoniella dejecticola CBS 10117]OBR84137.1 hypothetical protein I303_04994 [Kwoniella dejecticola CBS 10117]